MAKTVITNLHDMVASTATSYIYANKEEFRSTVPGPQGLRGMPGVAGVDGTSVTITSVLNNIDKSLTINFSDGTQHTTDPLKGEDGKSVTITNVINNANGTMLINFSDGTSHHTADLRGPQGPKGDMGDRVHHISYQRSKDPLGNEVGPVEPGQPGYTDTYAMWVSQEELPEMYIGEFQVHNGLNGLTQEEQAKLDSVEFGATRDQEAFEVPYDNSISGLLSEDVQNGIDELSAIKLNLIEKGQPNGVATLDTHGKVVLTQIPDSVLGQLEYMGTWNLTTFPTATQKGQYWIASVSGNGYVVGDWAVWNGTAFDKVDNTDAVATVAGRTGNVVLTKSDVGLANVDNTSDSAKPVSTAQQVALNLKANIASPTFTGIPAVPTAPVGTNTTQVASTAYVIAEINKIEEW